jgi:hypothetical protein
VSGTFIQEELRMSLQLLYRFLSYAEIVICIAALCFITMRRQWREYWALGSFLAVRATAGLSLTLISTIYKNAHNVRHAYKAYFYLYWASFAIEAVLAFFIIYGVFGGTIGPLKGLRRFGMLAVCATTVVVTGMTLLSPDMLHTGGHRYVILAVTQLQRAQNMLGVCLLAFVCYAVPPLGLSWRSRVFGVGLGLGLMAIANLVQSAWVMHHPVMYAVNNLVNGGAALAMLTIWAVYFAMREPERREIDFYGGSALLRLNRKLVG